jgi:uncharacterized protein (TIGR03790 family)
MKRSLPCALIVVTMILSAACTGNAIASYDDVAVIVNLNSSSSQTIGDYFKSHRNIPDRNIIGIRCSTAEEIDSTEFSAIRSQVESYLQANGLVNAINYIVTTKGVPLKVNRGDTFSLSSPSASIESELMCILGSYASLIGGAGRNYSPYYSQNKAFTRASTGIYLVTRLDAYSVEEVLNLIDRSGPNTTVNTGARFVLDQDPAWNSSAAFLNDYMTAAYSDLQSRGQAVELNRDSVYITSREGVLGYVSWGSNDHYADRFTSHALPSNSWSPGALVETYVSTSARSFDNPPSYGQSLIADLIEEGVSGAKGYVYEPYSSAMANPSVLFDRYVAGYNLAESYFMASRYLSWMDVVIGDPKTTIQESQGTLPVETLPVQLNRFDASSTAGNGTVDLHWSTLTEVNNYCFMVQRTDTTAVAFADIEGSTVAGHGTTLDPQSYSWSDHNVRPGAYYYRLKQIDMDGTVHYSERQLVVVSTTAAGVDDQRGSTPEGFALQQNYPNPFNPSTRIRFSIPVAGTVRLAVYNSVGQEVAVLVDAPQSAGEHEVAFSPDQASSIASGKYFYRLQAGNRTETKSMVYLK